MSNQVTRREMEAWLLGNGFRKLKAGMSGHVQYEGPGVKITLPGHGPQDLTKKHVALSVADQESGRRVTVRVDDRDALAAFNDPFRYAL